MDKFPTVPQGAPQADDQGQASHRDLLGAQISLSPLTAVKPFRGKLGLSHPSRGKVLITLISSGHPLSLEGRQGKK